ncbi:MAG: lysylphosphatidylglycerol synthase domain-containing protein [Kiritimatiellae bacterium]|nr:lysylphosphatidylglycerol synthase domain-containing protein [Kiritimatiellia bacterium]
MRKLLISAAVSLATLGLIFRLVFKGASQQAGIWPLLRDASLPLLLVYVVCQIGQTFFRAERYRCLLRGAGESAVPSAWQTFLATVTRNAMVDMLPARAGELGYLALMNRGYRVGADTCLSSMAVSFLLDLVALAAVLAVAVTAPWTWRQASWPLLAGGAVALTMLCLAGAVALFAILPSCATAVVTWCARRRLPRRLQAVLAFGQRVALAIARVRDRRVLLTALLLSLGVRFCKYGGLYAAFVAVTRLHLPLLAAAQARHLLPALLAAEGAASLPLPALLGFGVYEGGGTAVWKAMGFDPAAAFLAMLALHVLSQTLDYTLGAAAGIVIAIRWPAPRQARRAPRLWLLASGAALLTAAAVFAAWEWRAFGKLGALTPPGKGDAVTADDAERVRLRAFAARHRGLVVWSSNRFGNHDILALELPSLALKRLTSHPHTETFPRLSPDGSKLLFARSQRPWVSQRDQRAWDTWMLNLRSGQEHLVASNANAATWTWDGRGAVYQRHGRQVVLQELDTGKVQLLFESGRAPVPAGVDLQTPDYDARTGRLAVTLRGAARITAVYGPADGARQIGGGDSCQMAWLPDGALCSVGHGGRLRNAIYRHVLDPPRNDIWLDLPEPYSHEYFPRLSHDGRLLVLGASAGAHEHDTADYEIFAWEPGTAPEDAVRLTFHTGNDCWPDVWLEDAP